MIPVSRIGCITLRTLEFQRGVETLKQWKDQCPIQKKAIIGNRLRIDMRQTLPPYCP
ncbi:MAG: hypothetical protein LZF86_220057 [Nitrospira sp.]|nr:MAG: hypothetical protein LZF86_220057 [Nitrospira sp.]